MVSIDLRGPRLHIRRAQPADAPASCRWFANPAVTAYLPLAGKGALPIGEIQEYLARVAVTDWPELAVGIDRVGGGPIGCGGFRNFDGEAAELSLILGEPSAWGQGLGAEALRLLLSFAFRQLALARVWLVVRTDNVRAVRLFQRLGFMVVERHKRVVVVDGTPRDKFRMELQRDAWRDSVRDSTPIVAG
jgi:RimJ/RimL family protein N-acetyltransferase